MTKRPQRASATAQVTAAEPAVAVDPFRETIVIAEGPNPEGHDHQATSAQNEELAKERLAAAEQAAQQAATLEG